MPPKKKKEFGSSPEGTLASRIAGGPPLIFTAPPPVRSATFDLPPDQFLSTIPQRPPEPQLGPLPTSQGTPLFDTEAMRYAYGPVIDAFQRGRTLPTDRPYTPFPGFTVAAPPPPPAAPPILDEEKIKSASAGLAILKSALQFKKAIGKDPKAVANIGKWLGMSQGAPEGEQRQGGGYITPTQFQTQPQSQPAQQAQPDPAQMGSWIQENSAILGNAYGVDKAGNPVAGLTPDSYLSAFRAVQDPEQKQSLQALYQSGAKVNPLGYAIEKAQAWREDNPNATLEQLLSSQPELARLHADRPKEFNKNKPFGAQDYGPAFVIDQSQAPRLSLGDSDIAALGPAQQVPNQPYPNVMYGPSVGGEQNFIIGNRTRTPEEELSIMSRQGEFDYGQRHNDLNQAAKLEVMQSQAYKNAVIAQQHGKNVMDAYNSGNQGKFESTLNDAARRAGVAPEDMLNIVQNYYAKNVTPQSVMDAGLQQTVEALGRDRAAMDAQRLKAQQEGFDSTQIEASNQRIFDDALRQNKELAGTGKKIAVLYAVDSRGNVQAREQLFDDEKMSQAQANAITERSRAYASFLNEAKSGRYVRPNGDVEEFNSIDDVRDRYFKIFAKGSYKENKDIQAILNDDKNYVNLKNWVPGTQYALSEKAINDIKTYLAIEDESVLGSASGDGGSSDFGGEFESGLPTNR